MPEFLLKNRYPLLLVIIFFAVRIFFYSQGLTMNVSALDGGSLGMQLIDTELLRNDLLNSIYYLHTQPPLYNLSVGIILKLFPVHFALAFQVIFAILGLVSVLLLFRITRWLAESEVAGFAAALLLLLNPGAILFENLLFYTYIVVFLLLASAFCLVEFLRTKESKYLHFYFFLLAFLVLVRTLYHPVLLALCAVFVYFLAKKDWRTILKSAALPFLIVGMLLGKNYMLYGKFSFSTWLGIQYWRIMLPSEIEKRRAFVEQEGFSEIFLLKDNDGILNDTGYSNPYPYTHPLIANTKASNGLPNFHCGKFDAANDSVARAIMPFLKKHPEVYARKVTLSGLFFFWPISSYWATELMKPGLGGYDYIFSHQFLKNLPVSMKAVPVMLQYGLLFIAIFLALTKYRKRFHDVISPERRGFFYYMLFIWVYAFTLLTLLEHGENMRNRLHITPYFFAMCVFVLVFFLRLRKANREKG